MAVIEFSKEEKERMVPLIQSYLKEELQFDVGGFDAEFLLDFFTEQMGAFIYNRALSDAHALLVKQLDAMSESLYELEKAEPFGK